MTVYETAGEAVICRAQEAADRDPVRAFDHVYQGGGVARDLPEVVEPDAETRAARDVENAERSARRIRSRFRRYAVANRCDRVVTLTYRPGDPCPSCGRARPWKACRACRARVRRDITALVRRLRAIFGPVPYGYALEAHSDGSAHAHVVVNRRIAGNERATRILAGLWRQGYVDADPPRHEKDTSGREQARRAARYAAKYATKDTSNDDWQEGEHAYEVGQGFQPVAVRAFTRTRDLARHHALRLMGGEVPRYEWYSEGETGWTGPPVAFLAW